ncbi:MAG: hypothetical protein ACE5GM_09440 [bacterium]
MKKTVITALAVTILGASYSFAHRFIHDRMKFNCRQIGCLAGEPEEISRRCRCGEVNILKLPCGGKLACASEKADCAGGRYCKAFLPECLKQADCKEIDLEAAPEL